MKEPIRSVAKDGLVWIAADPATAVDIAEAWSMVHATCDELEADRPGFLREVLDINISAAQAYAQKAAEDLPAPVMVPLFLPVIYDGAQTSVAVSCGEAGTATATSSGEQGRPPRSCSPALSVVQGGRA